MAPGSRSTPLVAAAVADGRFRIQTHVDERGAAFYCLGFGRATGIPAVWLTTSGTAVANGLPAAVEASQDGVPLVLLTADRPPELIGTGANQTIRQEGIFGSYPRHTEFLPAPEDADSIDVVRRAVDRAVQAATGEWPGPVHINAPFRKPLEPTEVLPGDREGNVGGPGETAHASGEHAGGAEAVGSEVSAFLRTMGSPARGLLLAGRLRPAEAAAVQALADSSGWPLVADICSQLRMGPVRPGVITLGDLLAGHAPAPDVIIQVGRMPVSQRLTRWLASAEPSVWAVLADGTERIDPHGAATHRLSVSAAALQGKLPACDEAFAAKWGSAERTVRQALPDLLGRRLTEPAVANHLSRTLPQDHGLVLAASMPVRDMNTFAGPGPKPRLVVSNRGASGIDGTLATAAGVSRGLDAPVTVVCGDLAFLHDLNSLALIARHPVRVVAINNDGGAIFSFLPISAHKELFEPYFATPHGLSFEHAAAMFGIPYVRARRLEDLEVQGPAIVEVNTKRAENTIEHQRLRQAAADLLA